MAMANPGLDIFLDFVGNHTIFCFFPAMIFFFLSRD